jgi:hypothetical protein
VTERPTRKEREDIVRGIAAKFYDVSSNQVRISFLQQIRDHRLRRVVSRSAGYAAARMRT